MTLSHDAAGALIADLTRRMEALRAANYSGRDGGGLAEAIVDGDGLVVQVKLARTVARYRPEVVAEAVRAALDAAAASVAEAYGALAQEAETWEAQEAQE